MSAALKITPTAILDYLKASGKWQSLEEIINRFPGSINVVSLVSILEELNKSDRVFYKFDGVQAVYKYKEKSYARTPITQKLNDRTIKYKGDRWVKFSLNPRVRGYQQKIVNFFHAYPNTEITAKEVNKKIFNNKINKQQVKFYLDGMPNFLIRKKYLKEFYYSLK